MALFQIVAVSTRTQERTIMTAEPVTHAEAETMLSKMTQHKCRTLVIEEVPEVDPFEAQRAEMVADMHKHAALWRALGSDRPDEVVFVDDHQRLLWLVPGAGYCCMQISPYGQGRPMVMAGTFTAEQLEEARVVFNLCHGWAKRELKEVKFGHYCELAAKGCESAAQFLEGLVGGAK